MNQKNTQTKTFTTSDCMNLRGFADDFFNNIQIDCLLSENSVVVSLNAKFGMGKSYFLEMFKNYLKDEKKAEAILINSWKNDFCDDPLIAIIFKKKMIKNQFQFLSNLNRRLVYLAAYLISLLIVKLE